MRRQMPLLVLLGGLAPALPAAAQDCDVSPHPSWKVSVEFPGDPFAADPSPNPRWIKFTILNCDPTRVYFQNSRDIPFHYDFATEHLDPLRGMSPEDFDARTLYLEGQAAVLGAVILPPSDLANPADFGIQFAGRDPYPPEMIVELFQTVLASVVHDGAQAYYFPAFEQKATAKEHEVFLSNNGVLLGVPDRWSQGNSIYAEGWALGTLTYVPVGEIRAAYEAGSLRPADILLTDGVPAELPFVAGILSLAPATPNSHVAILARNYGVPFLYLSVPGDAARASELDGRTVIVSAHHGFVWDDFRLIDIDGQLEEQTLAEILALKDLPPLDLTPVTPAQGYSAPVADLSPDDMGIVGGKAANYSLLLRAIPENTRIAAAFTFNLWTEFLSQSLGNGRTLREEIDARLAPHASYPPPDVGALAQVLDGVRDLFKDPDETVFSPELQEAVITTVEDPRYGFDPARKIRVRSSTNFEDGERVTGAGLFDSRSGCLLDDLDGDEEGPSHCDATKSSERGMFRAIRRVFASFYNDNAYLERLRWSVDESQVGMALLVHHSFPDEIELANGVATLTRSGPNYSVDMVTQVGATSVANPADGSLPETTRVKVYSFATVVQLVQESNLLPLGATVLEWKEEYERFGELFAAVAKVFEAETGTTQYTLDFEYKKIAPGDQLIVKQVRQIPQPDDEPRITPFLINESKTFTTLQAEEADIFSDHRLKSTWMLETRDMWLTEENLRDGMFLRVTVDYSDGCDVFRFDGEVPSLPQVEQLYADDGAVHLRWRFAELSNARSYELSAGPLGSLVSPSESPFVTLQDLAVRVDVTYDNPVLGWEDSALETKLKTQEHIMLAAQAEPQSGDLEQLRSIEKDGVSVTARFYWPPAPPDTLVGYTAPLVRWAGTVIEGLTTEPIVLVGDRSQTYQARHHNMGEYFLFSPREEEGISPGILAELEEQDVRWIQMMVGNIGDRLELYGACELQLACACGHEEPVFQRGDCNSDADVDVSDAVCTLGWLFLGGTAPGCKAAANSNGDAAVDISDPIWTLEFLFLGGPAPIEPFPSCGVGPLAADKDLGCESPPKDCR